MGLSLIACNPVKPSAYDPKPLVINTDNTVVDGGTYQSITVEHADNVEIKNVTVDGSTAPDSGVRDCIYILSNGSVNFHDSTCQNTRRQGLTVISTRPTATINFERIRVKNPARYAADLEPNTATQHIHNVMFRQVVATGGGGGFVVHGGCCDDVQSYGSSWNGKPIPDGRISNGIYP